MRVQVLEREQILPGAPVEVFPFFADAHNLERITPPLLKFRVITPRPIEMGVGSFIQYSLRLHGAPVRWNTLIQSWDPPFRFVDVQVHGPYKLWHHTHTFAAIDGGTLMRDVVRYDIGYGPLGTLADRLLVKRDLERIFDFRAEEVHRALAAGVSHPDQTYDGPDDPPPRGSYQQPPTPPFQPPT